MSDTKITVKEFKEKTFEDKDNKKWKVSVEKKEVNFGEKPEKGKTKSKETVKVTFKEDKKDATEDTANVEVIYDSGWFSNGVKLPKEIKAGTLELKEEKSIDAKGFRIGFYVLIVVGVLLVVGLLWWWFASSRKEDKEEEGL